VLNIIRNSLLQEKRKSLQKGLKQASKDAKQVLKGNIQTPSKPVAAGSRRSGRQSLFNSVGNQSMMLSIQ
jgi:hypothetical protein